MVPKHKKRTGFEGKTLWEWLDLIAKLAIPIIVLGATIGFGWWQVHLANLQHQSDQKLAQQQHEADQQQALDQQRATILQTYTDNIQDLLLNHNLLKSKPGDGVSTLARARTLTALEGLDTEREVRLLLFLYEAKLIGFEDTTNGKTHNSIINLSGADFRKVNLDDATLTGIDLSGANLGDATLTGINLSRANLSYASIAGANLKFANLSYADLSHADLNFAKFNVATLTGAHLSYATFFGADLFLANFSRAYDLTQQQLDEVSSCKGTFLPEGLRCHHNL